MPIVAHFYPNGEFSIGSDTSRSRAKKRTHQNSKNQVITNNQWKKEVLAYARWKESLPFPSEKLYVLAPGTELHSRSGYSYWLEEGTPTKTVLRWEDSVGHSHTVTLLQSFAQVSYQWGLVPLVHQMIESCEIPKSRKKLNSMTKNMARNIRNAVYLLEQQAGGKDVLSFLTLTLPGLSQESLAICCENWDKIVKRFFDWLRKHLAKYNLKLQHVYCTEIQTKRLENRNEYAPHLHVVFKGRHGKKKPWLATTKQVRQAWSRAISGFVSERFDSRSLENLQRIKYSAARYLSKYLSKSTRPHPQNSDDPSQPRLKTQWGGMARSLSRLVRSATCRLSSDGMFRESLVYILTNLEILAEKGFIRYFRRGFILLSSCHSTGFNYGLHVVAGCLTVPTYEGGLIRLYEFCQLQSLS